MRQLRKQFERASTLKQKGFVLIGTDGNFALMKSAYGAVVKAVDDLMKYCNKPANEPKRATPSLWKQEQTVPVCSKQVISTSRNRFDEDEQRFRKPEKYNPNKKKEHRDRTRIVQVLADA